MPSSQLKIISSIYAFPWHHNELLAADQCQEQLGNIKYCSNSGLSLLYLFSLPVVVERLGLSLLQLNKLQI
jgi:hypothetical protein